MPSHKQAYTIIQLVIPAHTQAMYAAAASAQRTPIFNYACVSVRMCVCV